MNTKIFKKLNLKTSFSRGLVDKTSFLAPLIVLEAIKRPKLRFNNQKAFLKKYLKTIGKKSIKDTTAPDVPEYLKYMDESEKNGETKEFIKWRKNNQKKIIIINKLVNGFNKLRNYKKNSGRIINLNFDDGMMRIESGDDQIDDHLFDQRQKMKLSSKKILMKKMTKELESFVNYVKEKIY